MKSDIQTIKIKLDVPDKVIEYFRLEQQWENEGGAILRNQEAELEHEIEIPLKPGLTYYIQDGQFEVEDNHLYYVANIRQDSSG